ncbi:hypothetical protein DRO64_03730 [Candidatus Bathyarchaeota archaeon]|nr:MAG: hypothetical protein DRO64_03730 [Candidatus Bathyarchaeota archaeon]
MNIDLLYGMESIQGEYGVERAKREIGDSMCLRGGVYANVTLEHGGRDEVRAAVRGPYQLLLLEDLYSQA